MGIKSTADIFFVASVASVLMGVLSWAIEPMWLAATQWLLISIVISVWGLYLRLRDVHERNGKKK